jgi:hypothetical protein
VGIAMDSVLHRPHIFVFRYMSLIHFAFFFEPTSSAPIE